MGWTFRRSKQILPGVRMNVSKSGIGFSYGSKYGRITHSANGKKTFYSSIPGTGIRYRKTLPSGPASKATGRKTFAEKKPVPMGMISFLFIITTLMTVGLVGALIAPAAPGDAPKSDLIGLFFVMAFCYFICWVLYNQRKGQSWKRVRSESSVNELPDDSDSFMQSRFNREPKSQDEWAQTFSDYKLINELISKVANGETSNELSNEFPVKKGEVLFAKSFAALTDIENSNFSGGICYLTNKRISFQGTQKNEEWAFKDMTHFLPYDDKKVIIFQTTNKVSVHGIYIDDRDEFNKFQFFLMTAYALNKYPMDQIVSQYATSRDEYEKSKIGD
jgi:hypothetical protein